MSDGREALLFQLSHKLIPVYKISCDLGTECKVSEEKSAVEHKAVTAS